MYVQYAEPYPASRGDKWGATAGRDNPHRGADTAPGGLPALAVAAGKIVYVGKSSVLGNCVIIEHADGMHSGYAHLAHTAGAAVGSQVRRGQPFGLIGSTGTASKGRHLHYTIGKAERSLFNGETVDPWKYIAEHSAPETVAGQPGRGNLYTAAVSDGLPGRVYYTMAQLYSNKHFGTKLTADGIKGDGTDKCIVRIVAKVVNDDEVGDTNTTAVKDGKRGVVYWKSVQEYSNKHFGTKLTVDGKPAEFSHKAEVKIAAAVLNAEPGI